MSRTRSTRPVTARVRQGGSIIAEWVGFTENMWESSVPGPCSVVHTKQKPFSFAEGSYQFENIFGYFPPLNTHPQPPLTWGKLPTSTEFNVLLFLSELDETVQLLDPRRWENFSQGSIWWGVVPLLNDLKALKEAWDKRDAIRSHFQYEDETKVSKEFDYVDGDGSRWAGTITCRYHLTGYAWLEDDILSRLFQFLDQIGFHPDAITLWDSIPYSFVVDKFVKINNFLESLYGGGWVRQVPFIGWQTCKGKVKGTLYHYLNKNAGHDYETKYFTRYNHMVTLDSIPEVSNIKPPRIATKLPPKKGDAFELFNQTTWLAGRGTKETVAPQWERQRERVRSHIAPILRNN